MPLSGAERQARLRAKQSTELKALRKEVIRLRKLIELVVKKVADPEPVHNGA
jgi:hypothetical protein